MESPSFKEKILQRSYKFSVDILRFLNQVRRNDYSVQNISGQLVRSATSVGANITEAQAASSRKDFANFMNHALKSANETVYWLRLLRDTSDLEKTNVVLLLQEAGELSRILGSAMVSLRNKK